MTSEKSHEYVQCPNLSKVMYMSIIVIGIECASAL